MARPATSAAMADDKLKLKSSQGEIFEVEPEVGTCGDMLWPFRVTRRKSYHACK